MADTNKNIPLKKLLIPGKKTSPQPLTKPSRDWKKDYLLLQQKMEHLEREKKGVDTNAFFDKANLTRMIKGTFRFFDNKGGKLKWADRFPWQGAQVIRYVARDNDVVELPFYVAERLMQKGKIPVFTVTRDSERRPIQRIKEYRRRFEFFPFDEELLAKQRPDFVEIEKPRIAV